MGEEISIVLVEKEDLEKILHMIPDELAEEQNSAENIILAAKGPEDIIMGIVIFREYSRKMEVVWCYVEPEFRRMGICSGILQRMIDTVKKSQYFTGVYAQYMKMGSESINNVFKSNNFAVEEQEWPVYTFKLNEAVGLQLFTVNKKMFQNNVCPLEKCDDVMKKHFSNKLLLGDEINPIELPIKWDKYDQELSKVYLENGEISAIVLIERKKEYLEVAFAYVDENLYVFPYMIGTVFVDARDKYLDTPQNILVTSLDDTVDKLLLHLIPSARKTMMYYAHI